MFLFLRGKKKEDATGKYLPWILDALGNILTQANIYKQYYNLAFEIVLSKEQS